MTRTRRVHNNSNKRKRKTYGKPHGKKYKKRKHTTKRNHQIKKQNQTVKTFKNHYNKLVKLKCSPSAKNKSDFSCLSNDALYKLRNLWNARHPDSKIVTNDPKEIWQQLRQKMSGTCNKETCWLKQGFVNGELNGELKKSFAPESPSEWKKNPNEWLTSVDISNVMKQYEDAYTCFEFLGPSPIDYDTHKLYGECVWEELCHFNLANQIKDKKTKIGVIFNLDPHYKSGSHWVSLFININKGTIFYFDSVGDKIPDRIKKFVNEVTKQGMQQKKPIHFKFDQNHPVEHQYGNTECGIYSIFFIVHMLEDKITEHYLKTHILKDKYMEQFRKVYFNEKL
jgi:hypothetical protein